MGEEALVQLSRDEETTLNVFTNSNRQILLVLPLIPVKHPLMIFCKSAKTAHISTPVVLPLWRAFETPRRHPKCLANEIRLTPMGVSLGTGVQGTAVWVFECLCICALYVRVSLGISRFSQGTWGRLWNYRIVVAAHCSYSPGSLPDWDEHGTRSESILK